MKLPGRMRLTADTATVVAQGITGWPDNDEQRLGYFQQATTGYFSAATDRSARKNRRLSAATPPASRRHLRFVFAVVAFLLLDTMNFGANALNALESGVAGSITGIGAGLGLCRHCPTTAPGGDAAQPRTADRVDRRIDGADGALELPVDRGGATLRTDSKGAAGELTGRTVPGFSVMLRRPMLRRLPVCARSRSIGR